MSADRDSAAASLLDEAVMAMVCEAIVHDVAERLAPWGVDVMPLKGVYLQKTVYREAPEHRRLSDVDLLVPPSRFRAAHECLVVAGYVPQPGLLNESGCTYESPWRAHLDLHCALYDRFMFRVRSQALFERARSDVRLFGARVSLPDPLDLYAHLVGHFAKGRLRPDHPNLRDLPLTAAHFGLKAAEVASRLVEGGLARAARYVLPLSAVRLDDAFAREVLLRLPHDPLGEGCARLAHRALSEPEVPWLGQVVAAHLLNASLPRGLLSFVDGTAKWARREAAFRRVRSAR